MKRMCFFGPCGQVFNKEREEVRWQKEGDQNVAERSTTSTENMVHPEGFKGEVLMRLDENKALRTKLSIFEDENMHLKVNLQRATDETRRKEQTISSLHHQLSHLQLRHEEEMRKRHDEIISLHQTLQALTEEMDRMRAKKDQEIIRADNKRRARVKAHIDTLALLAVTQSALEKSTQRCDALQEKLYKLLAEAEAEEKHQQELLEKEESFRKELSEEVSRLTKELLDREKTMSRQLLETEDNFRKELSDMVMKATKEQAELSDGWVARALQWNQEKRELEDKMLLKEKCWIQEEEDRMEQIRHLTEENVQLQVSCFGFS